VYSQISSIIRWLLSGARGPSGRLIARWIFLRALGLIYLSAFYSLARQILGLIGPDGILPAGEYLQAVARSTGHARFWYAPTLLWFSTGSHALTALCWVGIIASLLVVLNILPRAALLICFVCFLSFVSAAGEFSGYQSDGMLLEAGFISLFLAPVGFRPGLALRQPPMRAAMFLLLWEWFRIYFESGVVKLASGDPQWRNFTAMDEYYQNGPLPTWIGWYVQHLPHWFHAATAFSTLALELVIVWIWFLPRPWRIVCFCIVTPWQIGVIATANYTFLNYLVLVLGFFLLDDRLLSRFAPRKIRQRLPAAWETDPPAEATPQVFDSQSILQPQSPSGINSGASFREEPRPLTDGRSQEHESTESWRQYLSSATLALTAFALGWVFYSSTALMISMIWPGAPLPKSPVAALEPFRIADRYGLFAVMTRGRYEIEFQGSNDGQTWVPYPFRSKPQDPGKAPGIYAPYQPRFDWNLWFASLGAWRSNPMVPRTEERLLAGSPDVLALFARNPFPNQPPLQIRAVLWRYWFTSPPEKHAQGMWWKRQLLGLYAPTLQRDANGKISVSEWPDPLEPRE
jgi:hypothetical protein